MIKKKYNKIRNYINEGDVLLFRGKGIISRFISGSTETPYTHVGVASWINGNANTDNGVLEIVEFREGSLVSGIFGLSGGGGGRSVNLAREVEKYSGQVDVYRPNPFFYRYLWNEDEKKFVLHEKPFEGKKVTTIMRKASGLPYGWSRIWWMARHKMWIWRLLDSKEDLISDELEDMVYPVCSTAVAYAFNKNGYDLIKNRSDKATEPGQIAQSIALNYFCTLI